MLLSGDRAQQNRQLGSLIDGYEQVCEFDRRQLSLIEPLRTLRLTDGLSVSIITVGDGLAVAVKR